MLFSFPATWTADSSLLRISLPPWGLTGDGPPVTGWEFTVSWCSAFFTAFLRTRGDWLTHPCGKGSQLGLLCIFSQHLPCGVLSLYNIGLPEITEGTVQTTAFSADTGHGQSPELRKEARCSPAPGRGRKAQEGWVGRRQTVGDEGDRSE